MKKSVLCIALVAVSFATTAQQAKSWKEQRSLLSFSAGISVPIICYAKTDISKNNFAGFAKPGFIVDINYAYCIANHMGISGSVFYSSNKTDLKVLTPSGNDQYRYFGILVGPLASAGFSSKTHADLKFMAGFARAFSPRMILRGETLMNKDASTAFTWSAGVNFRYDISGKTFLLFKADHTQLKPKFSKHYPEESLKDEQHIVIMNFDAGLGINFK